MKRLEIPEELLRQLIEVQKVTQQEAARTIGCSVSVVERRCKALGLVTQRTGPRSGPLHPDWKGGRYLVGGYWYVYAPEHPLHTKQGYVAEHRLVMEKELGRYLERHEVVHHIDGNRQNNAPGNLQVFATNAEHLKHELTGRIPNWTPEGRARTLQGIQKAASRRRSKSDGSPNTQTSDHPPSKL